MSRSFQFVRVADSQILGLFLNLLQVISKDSPSELLEASIIVFDGDRVDLQSDVSAIINVIGVNTYFIESAKFIDKHKSVRVEFKRGHLGTRSIHADDVINWTAAQSVFVDGIFVEVQNIAELDLTGKVFSLIGSFISMAPPSSEPSPDGVTQSSALLNQVSAAAAQMAEHTAARQLELDRLGHRLEIEAGERLEAKMAELAEDYATREADLIEKEKKLSQRAVEIDNRENTHVRREIQTRLVTISDGLLAKPLLQESAKSYVWLMGICGVSAFVFATSAFITGELLSRSTELGIIYFLEATRVLLGIGAATSIWFAIRQASLRYRQVAKWENELHRFKLDTERASFLIEGDLEARKVSPNGLPEVMLQRFSRGLFNHDGEREEADSVGHTLAHLLNRPAGLEIGPEGFKVSIDKASLRKASKELEREGGE